MEHLSNPHEEGQNDSLAPPASSHQDEVEPHHVPSGNNDEAIERQIEEEEKEDDGPAEGAFYEEEGKPSATEHELPARQPSLRDERQAFTPEDPEVAEEEEQAGEEQFEEDQQVPSQPAAPSLPVNQRSQELAPVILITTVDIGGGKSDAIELRRGGDPTTAARTFCEKHNLPPHIIAPLTQHILDNLSKAKQQDSLRQSGEEVPQVTQSESPPHEEEEAAQQQLHQQAQASAPSAAEHEQNLKQKLSFANGMNDKLYEQLSQKLMPVNDNERMLTVNSVNRHPTTGNRNAHSSRPMSASTDVGVPSYLRASANYNPRDSVHLRLYQGASDMRAKQEAKRRAQKEEEERGISQSRSKISWISQEMMRSRSHGPFENYGEMLYAEGVEAAAIKNSRAVAERAEREAKEIEGATFRPDISKLAKALWSGGDLSNQACWQRLSADKRSKTLEAIREMKEQRERAELEECTFKPKVNTTSAALMADRSETLQMLRMSAHEQLFQDALRRQQKRDELANWLPEEVTFKPKVNVSPQAAAHLHSSFEHMGYSPPLSPTKDGGLEGDVRGSVVDRLYMCHQRKLQKQEEAREKAYAEVDPKTEQPLFKPVVGRAPRNCDRNPAGAPIGEFLYLNGLEEKRRKEAALEAEREAERKLAEAHHATTNSQKLFARLKAKRFSQIFDYLDEDANGLLDVVGLVRNSTEHMDNLDIEVREDVELAAEAHAHACKVPLLPSEAVLATATPEEQQQAVSALPPCPPVDLQTFSALMEGALLRKRKPRAYLVPSPTNKSVPAHPFKPTINKRSKKMAARLRPAELSPHDILHYNAEAVRTKHEALRKAMKDDALRHCTFQPRLNSNLINGKPVAGKALRTSGYGVGASTESTPRRKVPPLPEGAMLLDEKTQQVAAMRELGPVTGDELSHYMALEAEVEDALAGVSGGHQRLSELDQGAPTPQDPQQQGQQQQQGQSSYEKAHMPDVSQVLKARLPPGTEVDPRDMRATEEFLLDMLGNAGASSGEEEGARQADAPPRGSAEEAIQAEMMAALEPGSGKSDAEVLEILRKHLASSATPKQPQQPQPAPRISRASLSALSNSGGIGSNQRSNPASTNASMRVRSEREPYENVGSVGGEDEGMGEYAADFAALEGSLGAGSLPQGSNTSQAPRPAVSASNSMKRPQEQPQQQQAQVPKSASSSIKVDTLEELAASLAQWDHVLEPSQR